MRGLARNASPGSPLSDSEQKRLGDSRLFSSASKIMISPNPINSRHGLYRAMLIALALLPAGCSREDPQAGKTSPAQAPAAQGGQPAQAPAASTPPAATTPQAPGAAAPQAQPAPPGSPPPPVPTGPPLSGLESLVAPIALYPDPLLAELLVASTYPLEVVQASRWLDTKPDLSTLKSKGWDASVMRLVEVPQVVKMMSDHLDWTTQLGDAFLAKPAETMDAIQALRRRATESGFLKDTPEQKVTQKTVDVPQPEAAPEAESQTVSGGGTAKATPAVLKKEVVYIEPAQADTVYVPQYSPEKAYSAPLAPPPATATTAAYGTTAGYAYPAAAPATAYYPATYPATTTTATTSTSDQLLTFGAGALVGGLLTWGIMEWADDDWDDHYHGGYYGGGYYPPVSHYYGNTVCRNGNCWSGGGGYANIDRGDINYNRNTNISGNEINISRDGTFRQDQLASLRQKTDWTPDARHRRGQQFPAGVQERLGRINSPGLAGGRLGAAETLPAGARGFGERPATLPAERRPSSAEVRERLAQKPGAQDRPTRPRPTTRDVQGRLDRGVRENALEGLGSPGAEARMEGRRGAESRQFAPASRQARPQDQRPQPRREPAGGKIERSRQAPVQERSQLAERRAEKPQRSERAQDFGGGRDRAQRMETQRRSELSRPNAFEGAGNPGRTQNFSQRGAASRQTPAAGRRDFGGGAQRGSGNANFGGAQRGGGGGFQAGGGPRGGGGLRGGGGGGGGRHR